MTHTTNKRPITYNPNAFVLVSLDIVIVAAYFIFLVKKPVRFARDSVLHKISELIGYGADKSARGAYHVLRSIVNNGLTRRISPSVSSLDDKIENACSTGGRWLGNALIFPFTAAFYLLAAAYSTAISIFAAVTYCVFTVLRCALFMPVEAVDVVYDRVFSSTKKGAESCKNMASKALYVTYTLAWKLPVYTVIWPATELIIYSLIKTLTLLYAPFSAPAYMLSSALGLNNRFNIYNYESGIGTVHNYIQDLEEKLHYGCYAIPFFACDRLLEEATTGDLDSADTEQVPAQLDSVQLEGSAHQQQMASA